MTIALLKSSKHKENLYRKCIGHDRNSNLYREYINYRNQYNKISRKAKQAYFASELTKYKNNAKFTWKTMNKIIGRSMSNKSISEKIKVNDIEQQDPNIISDSFCNYFTNIGMKYASKIPEPANNHIYYMQQEQLRNSFFMSPTDPEEIHRIIMKMKPKNSCGHDGISSKLLKNVSQVIAVPLSIIINKSIETGVVPRSMKLAKVIPIYKAKDKTLMENYRPISLLPTISKVLEKVVHCRLYKFLCLNNQFTEYQFGFRPNRSTTDAVCTFISDVMTALDNKQYTLSVLLDLSKAFDTIDHNILLLSHYGVRGLALDWFRSYLSGRSQFVRYRDANSPCRDVTCGVPQGSVLGPLLFIIYTNDLTKILNHSNTILFADDTTLYASGSNLQDVITYIEQDLYILSDWFCANKLSLNTQKTNFMVFSPNRLTHNNIIPNIINLGDKEIKRVSESKFLGIFVDDGLDWAAHISHLARKISSGLYAIKSAKNFLSIQNLKMIYQSLVHSHLLYGAILWGTTHAYLLNKIKILQKKCIRLISKSAYNAHTEPLFRKLKILNLDNIVKFQLGIYMYKYSKNALPLPLLDIFTRNRNVHQYHTRHHNDPHIFHRGTNKVIRSFIHKGPNIWASLPNNIKGSISLAAFKSKLKYHIANSNY